MPYAIYLRKSRVDLEAEAHGEGDTLARHRKTLLALAAAQQLNVTHIYEEVVSGDTIAARPQMQQLLADVDEGLWEGVLVMEVERLARGDTIDQGIVAQAFKVTDTKIIRKIAEASQAGVPVTMLVRGICCLIPQVKGYTENVHVYSIVGKLLEHSRIYCFGAGDDVKMYLSSADLMTRNMSKRVEIAWPIFNDDIRMRILDYIHTSLKDTAKLRELLPDGTYTPLGTCVGVCSENGDEYFDSQVFEIQEAARRQKDAAIDAAIRMANKAKQHEHVAQEAAEPGPEFSSEPAAESVAAATQSTTPAPEPVAVKATPIEPEPTPAPAPATAAQTPKAQPVDTEDGPTIFAPASSVPPKTPSFIDQKPQIVPIPKKKHFGFLSRLFGRK